ncbi:MAG: sugar phosphate isomerase/epimerase family protein [Phycisphaerae bacterium]
MWIAGFADEAADRIEDQISLLRELGWNHIEVRKIDGRKLNEVSQDAFDHALEVLKKEGVQVPAVGSPLADGKTSVEDPMEDTLAAADVVVPRVEALGARKVRVMSYPILKGKPLAEQKFQERVRRLNLLKERFDAIGVTMLHENCGNYGGIGPQQTRQLLEAVPGMELVLDTGNAPVVLGEWNADDPWPKDWAWRFYSQLKEHVKHVHIKEFSYDRRTHRKRTVFPGEGEGSLRAILTDLRERGYDGGFTIEPHMMFGVDDPAEKRRIFIEYGRRFEQILRETGWEV